LLPICEEKLTASLAVENAAVILTLAAQHKQHRLEHAALQFVARNAPEVMRTDGWAHLKSSRPDLIEAALEFCAGLARPRRLPMLQA